MKKLKFFVLFNILRVLHVLVVFSVLLMVSTASAAPTISTITGTFTDGGSVTVGGTGYGTKSPAAPLRWAPFDTSSNASSLGQATGWDQIQSMSWLSNAGYGNGGGMQGVAGNGVWSLRVNSSGFNWNDLSQKYMVMRRTKQNYIVPINATNNQKNFRILTAGGGTVPNIYWSIQNNRCYVENTGISSPDPGFWGGQFNPNTTNWIFEEIVNQASSSNGTKDGSVLYRIDGVQKASGNVITRSASAPGAMVQLYSQDVIANKGTWTGPAWSTSNNYWQDDVYIDNTWQRVLVGDASTYGNCRHFGIIVPSAWSATSVTGTLQIHSGDFAAQTTAYAYVFDNTNTPNTAGKQFVIGGTAAGNPPPSITSVLVSTGSPSGTTVSTITGSGFIFGVSVQVGTSTASSTYLNSTAIQFTIPAGVAGVTGLDLVVLNIDGQFSTLPSTMSYTPAVGNVAPYNVSAGDNWVVTLPSNAGLSGFALDDGLPSPPAAMTYLWQQKSGPGTITFSDATSLTPTASFSVAGTYTVSMTANDSLLSTESPTVTVIVFSAAGTAFPWKR